MSVHSNDTTKLIDSVESKETTNFVDGGDSHELKMNQVTGTDVPLTGLDIPSFMRKPYLFSTGTFTPSSVVNSLLMSASVGTTLIGNPQWINKMYGFNMVRGNACVKIVINANPFQAGRLLLHFQPGNLSSTRVSLHNATIATKTTQPGVEIDLRQSSVTMKVPYAGPKNYYSLSVASGDLAMDWGTFYLSVISPLSTGASGDLSVSWSAYMWFEEFELAAPLVPQSYSAKRKSRSLLSVEQERVSDTRSASLASMASKISEATGTLSAIPGLGAVMGPLSWASGVASGVFDYLGWSKPLLLDKPVITNGYRYLAVSDAIDVSVPLTIRSDNKVSIIDCCSGRSEDEMSFQFLKQIPSLVNSFVFTETDSPDTVLYTQTIRPSALCQTSTKTVSSNVATYTSGPPIHCMSNNFSMYRGSIILRLSFVKTDYHCGRLQVTFTPNSSLTATNPTIGSGALAMRTIIDLREFSDISIELPFLVDSSYIPTNQSMGTLQIRVLNQLKAPETASNSVVGLIYYHGGTDFEFEAPSDNPLDSSFSPCVFSPQADVDYTCLKTSSGGIKGKSLDTAYSEMSVGEHFTSIRQLLSRMTPVDRTFGYGTYALRDILSYWPWHTAIFSMDNSTGALSQPTSGSDTYSFYSQWFAYYRGAMNLQAVTTCNLVSVGTDLLVTAPFTVSTRGFANASLSWSPLSQNIRFTGYGIRSGTYDIFRVPYYCRTHCSQVPSNLISNGDASLPVSNPISVLSFTADAASPSVTRIMRATADDFQFSYFIGTVPILTGYT